LVTNWDDMEKTPGYGVTPSATNCASIRACTRCYSLRLPGQALKAPEACGTRLAARREFPVLHVFVIRSWLIVVPKYLRPHAVRRLELGGRDLNEYLLKVLAKKDFKFTTSFEKAIVADLKEKLCYVCRDYQSEEMKVRCQEFKDRPFELPDGSVVMVGPERFRCPEMLFQPSLFGKDEIGIQRLLYQAIRSCNLNIRGDLAGNVVLAGGSSLFDGMPERIRVELEALVEGRVIVKVTAEPMRKYCTWMGGSLLASLGTFQHMWIAREEYDDEGPEIVHGRCY
ncbi:ACT1, partial [Symbiodinium pilosum]